VSCLVNNACLARGEEKELENAAAELTDKLHWTCQYGNCPYIFGYYRYANDTMVTFCYINIYHENSNLHRVDLDTYKLNTLEGHVEAF
jgi:hypothetical protein